MIDISPRRRQQCLKHVVYPFTAGLVFLLSAPSGAKGAGTGGDDSLSGQPFVMPTVEQPQIRGGTYSIVDFGGRPDGRTMNTKAFADAIGACSESGGGTVVVPPGAWLTGPIRLQSNVNLRVEKGALVLFSRHIEDYPLVGGGEGGRTHYVITPPISAYRSENFAITGGGIFDGSGDAWRYVKKSKLTPGQWKALVASGGVVSADGREWWPSKEAMEGEEYLKQLANSGRPLTAADFAHVKEYLRPDLVSLVQCRRVLLDGPTFENSPRFHIHPIQCEDLTIRNISVIAPWYGQNTDGIDLGSCRNVVVDNCTVDVGDDGICLKPGTIAKNQSPGPACQNILIRDCVVYHAHGGFVIGSESFGGVSNVSVRNCVFVGTDVGLRFKSLRGRGGLVERVFIDGIRMSGIETDAVLFDMYYSGGAPDVEAAKGLEVRKAEPVTTRTPRFRDIRISNVVCDGADRAIVVNGLPEMPVKDISFANCSVTSRRGAFLADADGVSLDNCAIVPAEGPVFAVIQSRNISVNRGTYPAAAGLFLRVTGTESGDIRLVGLDLSGAKPGIELGKDVRPGAVVELP